MRWLHYSGICGQHRCRSSVPFPLHAVILVALAQHLATSSALKLTALSTQPSRSLLAQQYAKPDFNIYHRKDDLLEQVTDIVAANPDTFAVEWRNVTDDKYAVEMMVINVDLGGLQADKTSKTRYFIDFGEHGRELISSELGLHFLRALTDPAAIRSILGGGARGEELYRLLKEDVMFQILPMENIRGRELVEKGALCERKNGRGVDPNRNWEVDWGKKEKDYNPDEEYPGTKPFSEPEVQVVLSLARELKPHVWLNVHSGMEAMFTPWDHIAEVPAAAQEALQVLKTIQADVLGDLKECVVGSGGKSVGYLAHGTATDYMFKVLKVPLPFTWEIFGDLRADYHDCFRMFNPVGKAQYDATIRIWLKALFRLIELTPKHSVVAAQLQEARQAEARIKEAQVQQVQEGAPQQQQPGGQQQETNSQEQQQQQQPVPDFAAVTAGKDGKGGGFPMWLALALAGGGLVLVGFVATKYIKSSSAEVGRRGRPGGPLSA